MRRAVVAAFAAFDDPGLPTGDDEKTVIDLANYCSHSAKDLAAQLAETENNAHAAGIVGRLVGSETRRGTLGDATGRDAKGK
jgi:hypothetical protein